MPTQDWYFCLSWLPPYFSTKHSTWDILCAECLNQRCSDRKQQGELTLLTGFHQGSIQATPSHRPPELPNCWLSRGQRVPQRKSEKDSFLVFKLKPHATDIPKPKKLSNYLLPSKFPLLKSGCFVQIALQLPSCSWTQNKFLCKTEKLKGWCWYGLHCWNPSSQYPWT